MANCKSVITLSDVKFESCGDLGVNMHDMLQTEVSAMTTVKEFETALCSELIDVKSRKTISAYPTLRAIYERYRDGFQGLPQSSAYDYIRMNQFTTLVGDYWIDLIEQVIPSTTIWGSTFRHRNTIFDKQKFQYKKYTLQTCTKLSGIQYPSPTTGIQANIGVEITDLSIPEYVGPECLAPTAETTVCTGVLIEQIDHGSEFIGTVNIIGDPEHNNPTGDTVVITECDLVINQIRASFNNKTGLATFTPLYAGGTPPYTFSWTIAQQTQEFSGWSAVTGTETQETFQVSGTPITSYDGDRLCVSLRMEDAQGCVYGLSSCINLTIDATGELAVE